MKRLSRMQIRLASILVLVLLAGGTAFGQGLSSGSDGQPTNLFSPDVADFDSNVDRGSEGITAAPDAADAVAVQSPHTLNYQGYVTDAAGRPLTGIHNLRFWLYTAQAAGSIVWGPETHNGAQFEKGLFHVVLGETVPIDPGIFAVALYLQVEVDGVTLSTRQAVRPSAYAFGLVPGARVSGKSEGTVYALTVQNTGTSDTDNGLYASGQRYGIYAEELGPGDVGIYTPDFVQAGGYKSSTDSYLWIHPMQGIAAASRPLNFAHYDGGAVGLQAPSTGTKYFYLPVTLPSVLYGQEVRVEELTVTCYTTNTRSYISRTTLYKLRGPGPGLWDYLIDDGTNRTATTATPYNLLPSASSPYTLTATSGPLTVMLELEFGSTADTIFVGGARLRLGHTD